MKKLFGTDGIRGPAGAFPLDEETVRTIGGALARQYRERLRRAPRFVTGRDTRESGEWIEKALHDGARHAGADVSSAAVITTPGVAFVTRAFGFDAGIVISASHNPYQDNGIKVFTPDGKKIGEDIEKAIEDEIRSAEAWQPTSNGPGVESSKAAEFQARYLEHLLDRASELRLDGFKLVVDCANGAASHLAPDLFRRAGADLIVLNDRPSGTNINENCGSLYLKQLCEVVKRERADFGVAFDGDADRALFSDEQGNIVDGDATLWIMARFLRDRGGLENGSVVATVMSNIGLELAFESIGVELIRTAVGDKYVLDELLRTGSELGGEQSGHVIFPKESLVGDGMMTTLFVLEAIRESGAAVSQAVTGFTRYPQILVNVKVREKVPFANVSEIVDASRRIEEDLSGTGRLLLRYSGTENLARVMIEGKDQSAIERQANELAEVIRTTIG